jgi:hypothetical protein
MSWTPEFRTWLDSVVFDGLELGSPQELALDQAAIAAGERIRLANELAGPCPCCGRRHA